MKIELLAEPELEFADANGHVDIRFGLANYGPLDAGADSAPAQIKVGLVGTTQTIEGARTWFERCRSGVAAKESRQPNLFPAFPGFNLETSFRSTLVFDASLEREIREREFVGLNGRGSVNDVVTAAVELFLLELTAVAEKGKADVFVCLPPLSLLDAVDAAAARSSSTDDEPDDDDQHETENEERRAVLDFHDLLKARAMPLRVPIQILLPATYDPSVKRRQKERPERARQLQDEATRAWNLHTALYYKAGGTPWRLPRISSELSTCFVGISFFNSIDRTSVSTSIAQVFNERGDGLIIRGGSAAISKDDRQPHLSEEASAHLLRDAIRRYRDEHRTLPARVSLQKTSNFTHEELAGFRGAIAELEIDSADFITVSRAGTRLFRHGGYPPLRGTFWRLDNRDNVLYTRGSIPFFSTYPGMYVPRPLGFRCFEAEQTSRFIATEILGLTKLNWNNTEFDQRDPITVRAAREVGRILKHLSDNDPIEGRYGYYM